MTMQTTYRSDLCGTLRAADAGRLVTLCGWVARRREHGEHLAFIDVRDHAGIVQCVVPGAHDLVDAIVESCSLSVRSRNPFSPWYWRIVLNRPRRPVKSLWT